MGDEERYSVTKIEKIPETWENMSGFVNAVKDFSKNESFLLENELNERTITHKLAEYLQREYPEYNVDCEYNRMPDRVMDREYVVKRLNLEVENTSSDDPNGNTVFPDIIVHKRGTNKHNFLVIEVKKASNPATQNKNDDFKDFKKLKAFTKELNYKYGIYLEFGKNEVTDVQFFEGGERI